MGDWEWASLQCDHCGAGFDQKTVARPEATETAGITQPAKEKENRKEKKTSAPSRTTAATRDKASRAARRTFLRAYANV